MIKYTSRQLQLQLRYVLYVNIISPKFNEISDLKYLTLAAFTV